MSSQNKRQRNNKIKDNSFVLESSQKKTEVDQQMTTTMSSYNNLKKIKKKKYSLTERKNYVISSNKTIKSHVINDLCKTFSKTENKL